MPIYEYACERCGTVFETFVMRRADEAEVGCPSCASKEIARVMSRPAPSRGGGTAPSSCGPVG